MKRFGIRLVLIGVLLALAAIGCRVGSESLEQPVTVRVIATKDFGRELIFEREVEMDRRLTAQAVLDRVTDFEMDGSYIVEFEGLRGNDQVYWLYYINGFMSNVFASGYTMRPGDQMHWDFHAWAGGHRGASAIIGSFPEPFVHGFGGKVRPTLVVYQPLFEAEALELHEQLALLGVAELSLKAEAALSESERGQSNLILIGTPESGLIADLNEEFDRLGMYASFDKGRVTGHDWKFKAVREFGAGTGVIQAGQNYWNKHGIGACENAVFIVSGSDAEGVRNASCVLIESAEAVLAGRSPVIANAFGVIVTADGEVIRTPL